MTGPHPHMSTPPPRIRTLIHLDHGRLDFHAQIRQPLLSFGGDTGGLGKR